MHVPKTWRWEDNPLVAQHSAGGRLPEFSLPPSLFLLNTCLHLPPPLFLLHAHPHFPPPSFLSRSQDLLPLLFIRNIFLFRTLSLLHILLPSLPSLFLLHTLPPFPSLPPSLFLFNIPLPPSLLHLNPSLLPSLPPFFKPFHNPLKHKPLKTLSPLMSS